MYLCCGSLCANTKAQGRFLHVLIQKCGAESGKQIRASLENIFESRKQIEESWELESWESSLERVQKTCSITRKTLK